MALEYPEDIPETEPANKMVIIVEFEPKEMVEVKDMLQKLKTILGDQPNVQAYGANGDVAQTLLDIIKLNGG